MAELIRSIDEMHRIAADLRQAGRRIGVVPTMGFLHDGHLALIREAGRRSDVVITTVFVNPTQFGPGEDFERYPRDLQRDRTLAESAGTTLFFAPELRAVYPEGYATFVEVTGLDRVLEGKSRPGHFRGVATIVLKLFNITVPHCALFGQKDAQQVAVIRRMVQDLNMDVELIIVPTVRERDGLAMSSRNAYLKERERQEARVLHRSLQLAATRIREGVRSCPAIIGDMTALITAESSGQIDYVSIADAGTLKELSEIRAGGEVLVSLAVRFGTTRLIDNVVVEEVG